MRHQADVNDELRRIDPIDTDRLTAAWSGSAEKQALLQEIVAAPVDAPTTVAARPGPRPRRVLRLAAGLAVAAVALVLVQGVVFTDSPAFAVRELSNGILEITATAEFRDGDALAAELREYGIDVDVTALAASPSSVGKVEVFAPGGGDYVPAGITYEGLDDTTEGFTIGIDPNLFTETLRLELHVAARDGEPYVLAQEVFEPGEVLGGLHCALGTPLRADALVPYLDDLGVDTEWLAIAPTDDPQIVFEEAVQEPPSGQVLWGYPIDSSTVRLTVLPDGVTLSEFYPARLSDVACTAEQAAAWN